MTTFKLSVYRRAVTQSRKGPGCNYPDSISSRLFREDTKDIPESVEREKPLPNDLLFDVTAHGPYTKVTKQASKFSKSYTNYAYCDAKYVQVVNTSFLYKVFNPQAAPIQHPTKWWTRPLWDAVQDSYLDLSDTIAEYDQVVDMFVAVARAMRNLNTCLRRGKCKGAVRDILGWTNIPDAFLWNSFGVTPLCNTIADAMKQFDVASYQNIHRDRLIDIREAESFSGYYRTRTSSKQVVKPVWIMDNSLSLGSVAIGDPARWAWERMPFSFVVDWLLPIGGCLAAAEAKNGVVRMAATLTTKRVDRTTQVTYLPGWKKISSGSATKVTYSRTLPDIGFDPFSYLWSRPVLFGKGRAANALALLAALKGPRVFVR
jgi:hypothetical protein